MIGRNERGRVARPLIALLALLALGVVIVAWMRCEVHITAPPVPETAVGRPECPHSPVFVGSKRQLISTVPLSTRNIAIPEFHDCQRFITDTGYVGLFAIYAADTLAFIDSILDTLTATPGGTAAVAGATVYSYTDPYPPLGIQRGFNCLYLSRAGTSWKGWLVPKGIDDPSCALTDTHVNDAPGVVPLVAVTTTVPGMSDQDYPPVARWDWDTTTHQQFIGIKCGAAWCEVSPSGTASSPALLIGSGWGAVSVTPRPGRVDSIKGWNDAQLLAEKHDGKLQPSTNWGVIVPHPALFSMNKGNGLGAGWSQVATARVSQDYHGTVLNLMAGQDNKIYLCDPGAGICSGPNPALSCSSGEGEVQWWARVRNKQPIPFFPFLKRYVSVYHCVIGRPNTVAGIQVPGTARWRWLAEDETTWKRCDNGCCELR